jgi:hypothetical protein
MPSMQDRVLRVASLAVFTLVAAFLRAPAVACPIVPGAHVVLVSEELDPDVFLWDSSDRLARYAQGDYDVEEVLKHTTLIRAYSRAVTVGCRSTALHASYAEKSDDLVYLVGVRVATGHARGRYGWVLSTDLRGPDGRSLTSQSHPRSGAYRPGRPSP